MGDGKCGRHSYDGIDQAKMDAIIKALKDNGCTVAGNNPWDVDTHKHGIKLRGEYDPKTGTLSIIVTAKQWYVPCSKIWDFINATISHIQALETADLA
jgi:hypothetical protein